MKSCGENGVIRSRAVLVAIGIDWEGWRQVLGVEMAQERRVLASWKEFLVGFEKTRDDEGGQDSGDGCHDSARPLYGRLYHSGDPRRCGGKPSVIPFSCVAKKKRLGCRRLVARPHFRSLSGT